jgi:biotin carboxyl carrier protein
MTVWIIRDGERQRVDLPSTSEGLQEYVVDGSRFPADARVLEPGVISLLVAGRQYRCVHDGDAVIVDGRRYPFEVDDPRSLAGRRGKGTGAAGPRPVKSPMPGRVVRVLVDVGDEVLEHQGVVVIEAMKMQNELKAPKEGRVARITVAIGDAVGSGEVLLVVE